MRSKGLGGTDIAAVAGLNPWKSPMDVYMEKTGITDPIPDNEALYWGRELEPAVLKRYAKETGHILIPGEPIKGAEDWILGTPDALCPPDGGVDAKTTGRPDDWGPAGNGDGLPDHVACQCSWYMGITGASWWDVALLILSPRREFRIYRIERDQEVIDSLVEAGRDFWHNHVLAQVPPPIDGSSGSSEYLKRTYPRETQDLIAAPLDAEEIHGKLAFVKEQLSYYEAKKAEAENRLKAIIGDAAGLIGQNWKITWMKNRNSIKIDWQKVAMAFTTSPDYERIVEENTTVKQGARVFRIWELKK